MSAGATPVPSAAPRPPVHSAPRVPPFPIYQLSVEKSHTVDSQPEPDIAVVAGDQRAFAVRHPGPDDIGLLVEVAESSLDTDRFEKARIYARAAIPVYWIINLVDRQVEVYSDPDQRSSPPAYRRRETYLPGQAIPLVLKGQAIAQIPVQDLLP